MLTSTTRLVLADDLQTVIGATRRYLPAGRKTPRFQALTLDDQVIGDCTTLTEARAIVIDKGTEPIVPAGLKGQAAQTFIATGKGLRAQVADAQAARAISEHTNHTTSEEDTDMPSTTTARKNSTRKARTTKVPASTEVKQHTAKVASGLTAAQVARDNELDPRRFRAFLRGAGIDRNFANKAAASKAVKAFAKAK